MDKLVLQDLRLPLRGGGTLAATLRRRDDRQRRPVVVIAHGFKGFKAWGFFPYLATRLAGAGFVSITFDFALNGIGEDGESFSRLDLFERNSVGREMADLRALLDAVEHGDIAALGAIDGTRLGLMGHSRGAAVALLAAADDPRPRALVTWAAVAAWRIVEQHGALWREQGYLEVANSRTGQIMRLGRELYEELALRPAEFDVPSAVRKLHRPLLLLHAEDDDAVPFGDSVLLRDQALASPTRLVLLETGGHTFGARHPFAGTTEALEQAVAETITWFEAHLNP